jgi:hypothetical protein
MLPIYFYFISAILLTGCHNTAVKQLHSAHKHKWTPPGNSYFITPTPTDDPEVKNIPMLSAPALPTAPADEKVIDSYTYTPSSSTPKFENMSIEQFEYERKRLGEK